MGNEDKDSERVNAVELTVGKRKKAENEEEKEEKEEENNNQRTREGGKKRTRMQKKKKKPETGYLFSNAKNGAFCGGVITDRSD